MNYLQLVQQVLLLIRAGNDRLDSPPTTIIGATGVTYEAVHWVRAAEQSIQSHRSGWKFMTKAATIDVSAGQRLIQLSSAIGDYRELRFKSGDQDPPFITTYAAEGDPEQKCFFIKWGDWSGSVHDRARRSSGSLPSHFSVNPAGDMVLDIVPTASFRLSLEYRARTVPMAMDDEAEPVVPEDYHDLIVWWAILRGYCLTRDKTTELRTKVQAEHDRELRKLYNEQLPAIDAGSL